MNQGTTTEGSEQLHEYNNRGNKVDKTETTQFELDDSIENHTLSIYYLERGLGSSNLKLTFNFPKQNTLNVTNDIDTSTANPIFKDALENIGSFAYEIKNQATSGSSLDVEQSAGYVSLGEPLVYDTIGNNSRITSSTNSQGTVGSDGGRDNVLNIQQTTPLNGESSDQEIIDSLVSVQGNADISDKAYLRFSAYNDSDDADSSGESIYVVLCDEDGNRMGGWASRLPYNGSSNSIGSQEWALVRIDINKLQFMNGASTFDRTNVTAVEFATRETTPLYIDQLEFYPAVTEKPSHRFSVGQEEISDYGSIEKKGLSDVDGAWYGHFAAGMTENTYRMVEDGFFAVGDDERAQFVDKFRVGSYLQITQRDIDPDVFSTTWSIREGINPNPRVIPENDLLGSRTDTQTVKNTGKRLTLEEQVTDPETGEPRPDDGRYVPGENGSDTRPEGGSFVYRSYDSPDDNHMNPVHLTVAFKNVLKTGSLTIQKEVQLENNQSAKGAVYEFEVIFTNVAGMGLEDAPIKQTIQVVIGEDGKTGATTFDNIPAGTDYTIRELKASGLELQDIVVGKIHTHEDVAKVEDSDHKPLYGKGTVYSSDQEFKFINKVEPFVMTIEKHWDDAGAEEHRPTEIGIKLWRREAGSETWENVTRTFYDGAIGENEQSYIKLSADNADPNSPNIWRTKTKKLDAVSKNGQTYIYKIEEMNLDTSERWNLNNYKAEYVQGDTETGAYIVINTPNAIEVKKVWEDRNDPSRPVAVRVRLERKLATESDDAYAEPEAGKYTVTLSTNGNPKWAHIFNALERVDSSGKNTYKYRVVETHLINADGTEHPVEKNKETNGYKTSYSENEDNTVLTITNFKGAGKARLIKYDRSDESKKLEGATFILSRLKPLKGTEEENDKNFSIGLGNSNDKYWTIDQNYSQVSYTTNEDGVIDFGFLPYGYYRVVETKAPDGYILDDTPYDFKVTEETMKQIEEKGEEYLEIEVPNKSTITLPISGAAGTFMFTLAGLILVVSAMLLYKLHLQKTRKRIRARAVARKNEREEQ